MNLRLGGLSSPKEMRNGWFYTPNGQIQTPSMNFEASSATPPNFVGLPKGIQVVLQEGGLWPRNGLKLKCGTEVGRCDPNGQVDAVLALC